MPQTDTQQDAPIFTSGEIVGPGVYRDMETGQVVRVLEPCELPSGVRVVRYPRLFRRLDGEARDRGS